MTLASAPSVPFVENGLPFVLAGAPPGHVHHHPSLSMTSYTEKSNPPSHHRSPRRRSSSRSTSSMSSTSSISGKLRLADLAKQHCMAVHTEAWREDIQPVRQYLPMQHIIGSLKRDRDIEVPATRKQNASPRRKSSKQSSDDLSAVSPMSDDSFLDLLRTPKRRRTLESSRAHSPVIINAEFDDQFGYQEADQMPKDLPRSALPGLNHALSLSTLTASERDVFAEYAPPHLEDPHSLMKEVLQLRDDMLKSEEEADHFNDVEDSASNIGTYPPIVPLERDMEVRKAFEEFIDFSDSKRYIAKI